MTGSMRAGIQPDALQIDSQSCRPEMLGTPSGTPESRAVIAAFSGLAGSAPTTSNSFPPKTCSAVSPGVPAAFSTDAARATT